VSSTASPDDPLGPLRAQSTPALIADLLRAEILAGTFPPHSQLSEADLARQLQVSRGPIREAMQRLIQEGLLRSERNRGVFVVALGHDDARDVYLARGVIEGAAAAIVARQAPPTAMLQLQHLLDRLAASTGGPWTEVTGQDLAFHQALVDAAGSVRLSRMFRTLVAETRLCLLRLEPFYRDGTEVIAEHQGILDALGSGRPAEAERLIRLHMDASAARLAVPEHVTSPDSMLDPGR
jgi:DNA-binding GntR family transcriptional regulator